MSDAAGLRRTPVQERSRARLERILAAAATLLAEGGAEALVLREVARRARVPIGSVYQYFPDKSGILRALVARYHARSRALLEEHLAGRETIEELLRGLGEMADAYFALHRDEPLWREVLAGVLGDPELQALNLEDSRAVGARLAEALRAAAPAADPGEVEAAAALVAHLVGAAIQLALAEPDPGRREAVFAAWKRMSGAELLRVAGVGPAEAARLAAQGPWRGA